MAMTGLAAASTPTIATSARPKVESFAHALAPHSTHEVVKGQLRLENAPTPVKSLAGDALHSVHGRVAAAGRTTSAAGPAGAASERMKLAITVIGRVADAQRRMDQVLTLAQSGKSFTPAELLSLQSRVYAASQELDLAGKVVEKATGGLKQVLQTQV